MDWQLQDLPPDENNNPRSYKIILEAKATLKLDGRVSSGNSGLDAVVRHLEDHDCDHAIVVGPAFQTTRGDKSALGQFIRRYESMSINDEKKSTITLITVDDLANLGSAATYKTNWAWRYSGIIYSMRSS